MSETANFPVGTIYPTQPWLPNAIYASGATVTPDDVNASTTVLPQRWFIAIQPQNGQAGATRPAWPTETGVEFQDGSVTWLCMGLYPV